MASIKVKSDALKLWGVFVTKSRHVVGRPKQARGRWTLTTRLDGNSEILVSRAGSKARAVVMGETFEDAMVLAMKIANSLNQKAGVK